MQEWESLGELLVLEMIMVYQEFNQFLNFDFRFNLGFQGNV